MCYTHIRGSNVLIVCRIDYIYYAFVYNVIL
jgi:hypothetical protein